MSLNHIQLNSSLVTSLYRNSLIETDNVIAKNEKKPADTANERDEIKKNDSLTSNQVITLSAEIKSAEWKYLGDYKKNCLLIVHYDDITYLPDKQLNFLTSILGACKLSLADVAILNLSNAPSSSHKSLSEKFRPKATILFGISPAEFEMPVNFPEFQVQPFNQCTFLHTPSLEKLESDKILKSKLWVCLRKIFDV
jgi:hypothetical protein